MITCDTCDLRMYPSGSIHWYAGYSQEELEHSLDAHDASEGWREYIMWAFGEDEEDLPLERL